MTINSTKALKITEEANFLRVVGIGDRKDFTQVINNSTHIHKAIQESTLDLILLDYTQTIFHLSHNEVFNLVKVFEYKLTAFKKVKMAVIVNNRSEELGNFWASICRKRGFNYAIFKEEPEALKWLQEQN